MWAVNVRFEFSGDGTVDPGRLQVSIRQSFLVGHKHEEDDEFFYVLEGQLLIDLQDRTVHIGPRKGFVVPKGIVHRTRALERTVVLMVENAGIIPTGN